MSGHGLVTPSTEMIVGVLVGITIMAGIVTCVCALSLGRRRRASGTETPAMVQSAAQNQPVKVKEDKPAKTRPEKAAKVKPEKPAKPAKVAKVKPVEEKKEGGGFFAFSGHTKGIAKPAAVSTAIPVAAQATKAAQPAQSKNIKADKGKNAQTPILKAVKEPGQPVEKAPKKEEAKAEKGRRFGLFGKNKDKDRNEAAAPAAGTASPSKVYTPPPSDTDANKPFVMPAAAQAAMVSQAAAASAAPSSPGTENVQPAQPPQGIEPTSRAAAPPAPAAGEAEKKEEENTDSIFNLFTDTEGEESEISKFAANFDNVSLDSLLGDMQGILSRLKK